MVQPVQYIEGYNLPESSGLLYAEVRGEEPKEKKGHGVEINKLRYKAMVSRLKLFSLFSVSCFFTQYSNLSYTVSNSISSIINNVYHLL